MSSSEQLKFVPDVPPVVESETPVANDLVAAEAVHGRGAGLGDPEQHVAQINETIEDQIAITTEPDIRKGDVFVKPDSASGARQIIEGVRGKGKDRVILYTEESQPGVPVSKNREALHKIQQKPLKNFEVQRLVGGFDEWTPTSESPALAKEKEYADIFEECQRAFAIYADVVRADGAKHYSDKTLKLADKIGKVSQEIGKIDDAWMEAHVTLDENTVRKEAALIDALKAAVAELPEAFLKVYPALKHVKDVWEQSQADNEDGRKRGGRRKQSHSRRETSEEREDGMRRSRSLGSEESVRQRSSHGQRERSESTMGIDTRMKKYTLSRKAWEQSGWGSGSDRKLQDWVTAITEAQTDLTDVAQEIERLGGTARWEELMQERNSEYQSFAVDANGDEIAAAIRKIDSKLLSGTDLTPEQEAALGEKRAQLQGYLFKYLGILRAAAQVLAELRHGGTRTDRRVRGQKRVESDIQSLRSSHARGRREVRAGNESPREDSPEQRIRDEISEDAEKDFYTAVADVKLLHEALYKMRELVLERRVKGEWDAALDPKQRQIIAEAGFRGILGEVDDIEDTLIKNDRRAKWADDAERVDWLFGKTERLQALSKLIKDVLNVGEKILASSTQEAGGRRGRGRKSGNRERPVVALTPEGRALQVVDGQYSLVPQAREVLVVGMRDIAQKTAEIIARLREALAAKGVSSEDQDKIIEARFLPKVIEGAQLLLSQAGVKIHEDKARQVAQHLLLTDATPKLTYDRSEA